MRGGEFCDCSPDEASSIFTLIRETLSQDHRQQASLLADCLQKQNTAREDEAIEKELNNLTLNSQYMCTALQTTLEILTNICSTTGTKKSLCSL